MPTLVMFASIRQAAGTKRAAIDGATVAEVLRNAGERFGAEFVRALPYCMVLVDDEEASPNLDLGADSEVALLPPVSGGQ